MRYTIQKTTLESIADAIRAKTETTGKMSPAQMATAISAIQTGVQPVGKTVQGTAKENISAGEFVIGNRVEQIQLNSHYSSASIKTMEHIGIDPNGNDLYVLTSLSYASSSDGQNIVFFKREGKTFTELKINKNILKSTHATYWYKSEVVGIYLIPNTNKLIVINEDKDSTGNAYSHVAAWIGQIDWTTYTLTALSTECKTSPVNASSTGKFSNNTQLVYDSINNCIYFINMNTGNGPSGVANHVFNVLKLNDDYTDFTWYTTVISSNLDGWNEFELIDSERHIYLIKCIKYNSSTSTSNAQNALYFCQINSDYTVSLISGVIGYSSSSSYSGYGGVGLVKLDNNHYVAFETTWSNPYYLGTVLLTVSDDYTSVTTIKQDRYYLPGTSDKPLQARGSGFYKLLPDNKISLLLAETYDSAYHYINPREIIFQYNLAASSNVFTVLSVKSIISDGYMLNGNNFVGSVAYTPRRVFKEYVDDENMIIQMSNGSSYVYFYHAMDISKADTVVYGIAMDDAITGENISAVMKG